MGARPELPEPPPEAVLIGRARQACGLTMSEAAARCHVVKASRWGQIENGYVMKGGERAPTRAGAMQLAHMARVVGLSPDRLGEVQRQDAAEILREILHQETEKAGEYPDPTDADECAVWSLDLPEETLRQFIDILRRGKAQQRTG
jgi:transcriptional regulator with XRE-family HTH domain